MGTLGKVLLGAIPVLVPLVAAALLMPLDFPICGATRSLMRRCFQRRYSPFSTST